MIFPYHYSKKSRSFSAFLLTFLFDNIDWTFLGFHKKFLPIYFPKIPMVSNWKPPRKRITVMRDGQPEVGSPKTKVRITIRITMIKAKIQDNRPPIKAIFSGASEKLTIPSIEYLKRDQKFQDVSPATRSIFLYSRYSVSNPTQAKIPLKTMY